MSSKRWLVQSAATPDRLAELSRRLGVLPLTAAVLLNRGLSDPEAARQYLEPAGVRMLDYRLLPGAEAAGSLLAETLRRGAPVAVAGDYDVDGITGSALLCEFIRDAGGECTVFLPDRQADGYGLNEKIVREALALKAGLLLTVDCGITAMDEIALAKRQGLAVVVTDHHEPGPVLPAADVVVNPKADGPETLRSLAGVGVALQVLRAAADALGLGKQVLRKVLDLAALGTVADVVPLLGENRLLVRSGLKVINEGARVGLAALVRAAGLDKKPVAATDLAFKLGPRLNAAGRLGDARNSLRLLLTRDAAEAEQLAQILNQENARRQALEQTVIAEALRQVEGRDPLPRVLVAHGADWPLGVLGLAASRLCERFHRPCFVLAESQGQARGSGRSIAGFALHEALGELAPLLEKWGGHEMAAGVTLGAEKIPAFAGGLEARAERLLTAEQLVPELAIDAATTLDQVTEELVREFQRLEPFGYGNPKPLLAVCGVRLAAPPRVVAERHLKLKVGDGRRQTLDVIGFGLGERAREIPAGAVLDLAGFPTLNTWNGTSTLQLEIKDFRDAERVAPAAVVHGADGHKEDA